MKVEINHLTKVIQGNVVLDDINACFSCASGENGGRIYGIQGINGSGKTIALQRLRWVKYALRWAGVINLGSVMVVSSCFLYI